MTLWHDVTLVDCVLGVDRDLRSYRELSDGSGVSITREILLNLTGIEIVVIKTFYV